MKLDAREVVEKTQIQGEEESIRYSVTTTPWAGSPSNASVKIYLMVSQSILTDVTDEVASGSVQINGDVITLPAIRELTAGARYRVEVKFDAGGSTYECYFFIVAQR